MNAVPLSTLTLPWGPNTAGLKAQNREAHARLPSGHCVCCSGPLHPGVSALTLTVAPAALSSGADHKVCV